MNANHATPISKALREYLLEHLGLNYQEKQDKDLTRKIDKAADAFGFNDPTLFVEWLLKDRLTDLQTGKLASFLTIGETYFMREKKSFDFLEQVFLPGLIRKRYGNEKRLRVWCAGCASGEEAYSLAIVIRQSIPDISSWNIKITATDINPFFLEKAKAGIYSKYSFRNSSDEFKSRYFIVDKPNEFQIIPQIKNMVTFFPLNLAGDIDSSQINLHDVDIIFCRNVFIYFSPAGVRKITEYFNKTLVKGGILVVSPVEASEMISPKFNKIHYSGFTIYQKGNHWTGESDHIPKEFHNGNSATIRPDSDIKNGPKVTVDIQSELNHLKHLLPQQENQSCPKSDNRKTQKGYEEALASFEQGNLENAESILTGFLKEQSKNGKHAVLLMARVKANLGKLREAEELFLLGIRLDKLNPQLYYHFATVMQEQQKDDMAINLVKQAIYLDDDFVLAHFLLGTLSMKSGNTAAGKKSFRNAMMSLSKLKQDDILPHSDGLTAGRFKEIINTIQS
jgi:chemotaxis protein methyltransferase CheR